MPAGLPVGPAWPGLASERKGTATPLLVSSVRHLAPRGRLGWGLGGSGCPAQQGSSGRTRRTEAKDKGEGRQTSFLAAALLSSESVAGSWTCPKRPV